jgi:CTP-dependent riboflavin kinase
MNLIKFMEVFDQFNKDVETDINKGVSLLNIDYYMRDLKKHALEEYDEVLKIEQKLVIEGETKKGIT